MKFDLNLNFGPLRLPDLQELNYYCFKRHHAFVKYGVNGMTCFMVQPIIDTVGRFKSQGPQH